jgi:CHAD domain-containing protein
MKFVLKKKEPLPTGLRRIACEQLQLAMDYSSGVKPTAVSVHCARKAIKRTRAVLKLVRCNANRSAVKREEEILRDAAKLLAPNRDLYVQQMALKRLPICEENRACSLVWSRLRATQKDLKEHGNDDLKRFGIALKAARSKASGLTVDNIDSVFIANSLKRTYRRARRRFKSVRSVPTGEKLHALRKVAKTFWHQMQLIDQISSKKLCGVCRNVGRLAKVLGDEHDLFMLLRALSDASDPDSRAVKRELRQLRVKLQKRALKLGRKTFALAPSAFHERLSRCVK